MSRFSSALVAILCLGPLGLSGCADESIGAAAVTPPTNTEQPPASMPDAGMAAPTTRPSGRRPTATENGGGAIGAACEDDSDCREGLCLLSASIPGGYCSMLCGGEAVSQSATCPSGSACIEVGEAASVCLDRCGSSDGTCRPEYVCDTVGSASVCGPRCNSDEECGDAGTCNKTSGKCEMGGARKPGRIGEACATDADCDNALCLSEMATMGSFPGGYCVRGCMQAEENKPCAGNDGVCMGLPRADGTTGYACLGSCNTGVDCRPQYMCSADVDVQTPNGIGMCLPRCEHYPCKAGYTCDASVGVCMEGMSSTPASLMHVALGSLSFDEEPSAKPVTVDVPAGATSFTVIADPGSTDYAEVAKLVGPNGQVLFDAADPFSSVVTPPIGNNLGPVSLIYPNAPRLNIVPGKYRVDIYSRNMARVKVDAIIKRQSGVTKGGSLPVVFWMTKQKYVNAASAATNQYFQSALAIFAETYRKVGIELGPFIYRDLPAALANEYAVVDNPDVQLPKLFASVGTTENGINFFLLDQFMVDVGGGTLLGRAAGIPGPPAYPGLGRSGVTVALAPLSDNAAQLASTMAHEAGHYFGLYHTSERSGTSFDPLLDTPECASSLDANKDEIVSATECAQHGSDNLMFWQSTDKGARLITNDQRFVLLRNPSMQ